MSLSLEVGKSYKNKSGKTVVIDRYSLHFDLFVGADEGYYNRNGQRMSFNVMNEAFIMPITEPLNLIEEEGVVKVLSIQVGKTYFDTDHYPCTIVSVKEGFRDINIYIDEDGYEYTETGKILNENYDPNNTVQGDLIEMEAEKGTLPKLSLLEIGKSYRTKFNVVVRIVSKNDEGHFVTSKGSTYTESGVRLYTLEDEALVRAGNDAIVSEITAGDYDLLREKEQDTAENGLVEKSPFDDLLEKDILECKEWEVLSEASLAKPLYTPNHFRHLTHLGFGNLVSYLNGESGLVVPNQTEEVPVEKKKRFSWGDVIETFTYNFDGISTDIVKYHPYESANGGASLGCKGNQDKVMFYNDFVRESNESLLYIILLFLTQYQLGQNHRSLAKGLCKALDIEMKPVP